MNESPRTEIPVLNIPNILTGARLAVVPVFAWLLLTGEQTAIRQWITLLVFLAASRPGLAVEISPTKRKVLRAKGFRGHTRPLTTAPEADEQNALHPCWGRSG